MMQSEVFGDTDKMYMRRCIQLAMNGLGTCSPNPMVGAVIVRNGKIIGEGWHMKAGSLHAEPIAINSVKNQDWLKESTLYVSLEPCSHYGKTPPCVDLIIKKQIPKVVIGCIDVFPLVSGSGVRKLKAAGIEVIVGPEMKDCLELNKRFFTFHALKRPYILLKWAQTSDGFMDYSREPETKTSPLSISTPLTRMVTHKLRSEYDVILVGTKTALLDNPRLNVRDWFGKNPVRAVLDRQLVLKSDMNLFDENGKTLVFTEGHGINSKKLKHIELSFEKDFPANVLDALYVEGYQSLLVEGGSKLHNSFIKAGLWDELHIEVSPQIIGSGVPSPELDGIKFQSKSLHSFGEANDLRKIKILRSSYMINSLSFGGE